MLLDELILHKESTIIFIFKLLALFIKDLNSSSPPNKDDIELLFVIAIGEASVFPISIAFPVSSSYAMLLSRSKAPITYKQLINLLWYSSNLDSKVLKFPRLIIFP